ncbi:MAG: DUF930 domain-containing protein [Rhizobiales bacterium]|nr:DUF930 domain-containing protein [Hyphomicrobiales bacterium]
MSPPPRAPEAPEEAVPVEVWTSDQFAAIAPPAKPAEPAPPVEAPPSPPASSAPPTPSGSPAIPHPPPVAVPTPPQRRRHEPIRPTAMLAASVLANPRSRGTVAFLKSLDADGRFEQLCNLEAMAQIARAYPDLRPDRVIAYARADTTTKGDLLSAAGAAFHSGRDWINLSFTCRASRDRTTMIAFEFEVGEPIPRSDWTALNLPARP